MHPQWPVCQPHPSPARVARRMMKRSRLYQCALGLLTACQYQHLVSSISVRVNLYLSTYVDIHVASYLCHGRQDGKSQTWIFCLQLRLPPPQSFPSLRWPAWSTSSWAHWVDLGPADGAPGLHECQTCQTTPNIQQAYQSVQHPRVIEEEKALHIYTHTPSSSFHI